MKNIDLTDKNCILQLVDDMFWETNDIPWYYDLNNGFFRISDKLKKLCELDSELCIDSIDKLFSITVQRDQNSLRTAFQSLYMGMEQSINTEIRLICGNNKVKSFLLKGKRDSSKYEIRNTIITGTITDLQEIKKREEKLNFVTYYDPLTGLVNRQMFTYKTNSYINRGFSSTDRLAVLYINLDNLKQINDLYGHLMGDEIIKDASKNISSVLDIENILSRPGGDEFIILLQDIGREHLLKKINIIQRVINKKVSIGETEILLTSSIGVAMFPADGDSAEELINNAHTAMHKAKDQGIRKHCFYDKHIKDEIFKSMKMEKNLRSALQKRELYIEYQPQVDFNTGLIAGVEALIRWKSPVYGQVPPLEFIPVIENMGLILQIGSWVLEQACMQCKKWVDTYGVLFPVSVNISALQLKSENFLNTVMNTVVKSGIPAEQLQLEITESVLLDDFESTAQILGKMRQKGIKIALDDFGTGFSSLYYLKNLPIDTLKIDKSFVKGLCDDEREKAITGTIISLAHILKLDIIAEGVETKEQAVHLKSMNCNMMQGYYFGRPQRPEYLEPIFIKESEMHDKSACCR